jgi:hypothetical protein
MLTLMLLSPGVTVYHSIEGVKVQMKTWAWFQIPGKALRDPFGQLADQVVIARIGLGGLLASQRDPTCSMPSKAALAAGIRDLQSR